MSIVVQIFFFQKIGCDVTTLHSINHVIHWSFDLNIDIQENTFEIVVWKYQPF